MKTVGTRRILLAAMTGALGLICMGNKGWSTWDNMLERDETAEPGDWCLYPPDGWAGSDGGMTARHPSTNRTFMVFGDTALGNPPFLRAFTYSDQTTQWINNSILTFTSNPPTTPGTPNFYIRKRGTSGASLNWGANQNIMTSVGDANRSWMPSFSGDLGPTGEHWWWPDALIVPSGTNKLVTFWNPIKCEGNPPAPFFQCPLVTINGKDYQKYHHTTNSKVCVINDISGSAIGWANPTCTKLEYTQSGATKTPLNHLRILWGHALMEEGSYIYIFGATRSGATEAWDSGPVNVVVARATSSTIATYTSWEFLKTGGTTGTWSTGAPTASSQLHVVAHDASTSFTVDKITINNVSRYVMVQNFGVGPDHLPEIVVRISKHSSGTPYLGWHDLPANPISDTNNWVGNVDLSYGVDPPCGNVVYHMKGQWATSDQANKKLMISYYCGFVNHMEETGHNVSPWDMNNDGTTCDFWEGFNEQAYWRPPPLSPAAWPFNFAVGRIRFYNLDLMKLKPWCTSGCWMP